MNHTSDIGKIAIALGFFASCIKSGESWSQCCEETQKEANDALTRLGSKKTQTTGYDYTQGSETQQEYFGK